MSWLDEIHFDEKGLVPAITQDASSGKILMMAWMNRESLQLTAEKMEAVYWSRSRGKLWHKGEESGNTQDLKALYVDCDGDCVVLRVEQKGRAACHTGRRSCFYQLAEGDQLKIDSELLIDPKELYGK